MISEFLERLTKRKGEIQRKGASEWQTLVIAVADGQEIDPDETLTVLARLGKSTDDLAKGVELLNQRRAWSALVAVGATAEAEHPAITKKIESEVAAFAALEEKHEATVWPMTRAKAAAAQAMSDSAEARRRLVETANDPIALQAVRDAEERMNELRREKSELDHRMADKSDALRQYTTRGQSSDFEKIARLEIEVANLQAESKAFDVRATQLNGECESARLALLNPSAI